MMTMTMAGLGLAPFLALLNAIGAIALIVLWVVVGVAALLLLALALPVALVGTLAFAKRDVTPREGWRSVEAA